MDSLSKQKPFLKIQDIRGASTAIFRDKISLPTRWLQEHGLLRGRMLDYGSGRGFDADALDIDRYDPYWHPIRPNGKYNTILCHYVLNVVSEETQIDILEDINALLKKGGIAYVTVRRDMDGKRAQKINWKIQRWVELDTTSVRKTSDYEIYEISI